MASEAVTPLSVADTMVETSTIDAAVTVPNMPDIGMAAAMATETGSHISIHNNKSLLENVMRIGLNFHEKVPGCGKKLIRNLSWPNAFPRLQLRDRCLRLAGCLGSRPLLAVESSQYLTQK